jgi:hypothetical protein
MPRSEYAGGYTDMLAQRAAESRFAAAEGAKHPNDPDRRRKPANYRASLPRRMNFNDRRALDLAPARIAALEARITEMNAVLADLDLYRREPTRFRDTTDALAVTRDELAAAEDQLRFMIPIPTARLSIRSPRWLDAAGGALRPIPEASAEPAGFRIRHFTQPADPLDSRTLERFPAPFDFL